MGFRNFNDGGPKQEIIKVNPGGCNKWTRLQVATNNNGKPWRSHPLSCPRTAVLACRPNRQRVTILMWLGLLIPPACKHRYSGSLPFSSGKFVPTRTSITSIQHRDWQHEHWQSSFLAENFFQIVNTSLRPYIPKGHVHDYWGSVFKVVRPLIAKRNQYLFDIFCEPLIRSRYYKIHC